MCAVDIYDAFVEIYINQNYPEDLNAHQAFQWELDRLGIKVSYNQTKQIVYDLIYEGACATVDELKEEENEQ